MDKPLWILSNKGDFTVKSAWEHSSGGIAIATADYQMVASTVTGRLKHIFKAAPTIIIWELWKRKNSIKHGENKSLGTVIFQVYATIQRLVQIRNPSFKVLPNKWEDLLKLIEGGTVELKVTKVNWNFPPIGWIMCNTDGASRGNPGRSSYGFCLRNSAGDLLYAQAEEIGITTNTDVEVMAILEAMKYCRCKGLNNIIMQIDSEMIYKILEEGWKPSWGITIWIEEIKQLREMRNFFFTTTHPAPNLTTQTITRRTHVP
ncbi:uncharacterized protein LOC132038566 [Lycium ferocissimum]|uniref:uncharacterized protein LOC132038566 n=1 Tax=Lycium ferocissimum TaxID=112874 RepID=UPI00281555D7|nr:uncharacterized protein LOC132038566 [Lycium ferocissimum]